MNATELGGMEKMAIEDVIAQFESFTAPGDDAAPDIDAVLTGVTNVYNQDISIRDNAVRDREEKISALVKDKESLMLENYKLLMKQPAASVANESDNEPDESERAATVTFADIFNKK